VYLGDDSFADGFPDRRNSDHDRRLESVEISLAVTNGSVGESLDCSRAEWERDGMSVDDCGWGISDFRRKLGEPELSSLARTRNRLTGSVSDLSSNKHEAHLDS